MNITYFFAAAAIGFVLMAAVAIQAIEALVTTRTLIAKAQEEDPDFRANVAKSRVRQICILLLGATFIICGLVITFANASIVYGFMAGFVFALPCSYQRLQANRPENQEKFRKLYFDCYSDYQPAVVEAVLPEEEEKESFDTGDDEEVVPVSRPRR